jgi:uncharacterized protein YceK
VKALPVLALLGAVGFVLAGCGSGTTHTGTSNSVTLAGTTTIADMPTGTPIHCKGGPGTEVPRPGNGVTGFEDGQHSSGAISVTHQRDGSVVVSCRSG